MCRRARPLPGRGRRPVAAAAPLTPVMSLYVGRVPWINGFRVLKSIEYKRRDPCPSANLLGCSDIECRDWDMENYLRPRFSVIDRLRYMKAVLIWKNRLPMLSNRSVDVMPLLVSVSLPPTRMRRRLAIYR
ncbi:hypothetical protein EVAR_74965_1 [Eumeta japonica]|uniref:Uncharacterized protein n=1 Tax=Eumeta variegata TaxID=151549 RepID=A0A4C1UJP3_EUMVA|nr:hypothetical protein EVAR_74965_1 [Eumeta japonica]